MKKTDAPFPTLSTAEKEAQHRFLDAVETGATETISIATHTEAETATWQRIDCLRCANCCQTMTPHFTPTDIKRIATHFRLTPAAFKQKWLQAERGGTWVNRSGPCPFLDLTSFKCSIYAIRPNDCAGFPHLDKKPLAAYAHMHRQNLERCPATAFFISHLQTSLENAGMGF